MKERNFHIVQLLKVISVSWINTTFPNNTAEQSSKFSTDISETALYHKGQHNSKMSKYHSSLYGIKCKLDGSK
jgi:hypothetical protein